MNIEAAREHCARGASVWEWASNSEGGDPDVVLACAGDVATLETIAAAAWLRTKAPCLRVVVVNVVDLMALFSPDEHPHGMTHDKFLRLFTRDTDIVFAFHGYPGAVHQIVNGRPNAGRFHVRGYREQGTTTTPFDMVVINETSRYHLVIEALKHARRPPDDADQLADECRALLAAHHTYIRTNFEDMDDIRNFAWSRS